MRRWIAGVAVLVPLAALACQEATLGPPADANASFAATTITTNEMIPYTAYPFVPCANDGAGETVVITGTLHVLSTITLNASGGLLWKTLYQPMGISGVGLATGDMYRATGVTQDTYAGSCAVTGTYVNDFRMIGVGPGNNFMVHQTFHYTFNADGTLTAYIDNTTVTCQ